LGAIPALPDGSSSTRTWSSNGCDHAVAEVMPAVTASGELSDAHVLADESAASGVALSRSAAAALET